MFPLSEIKYWMIWFFFSLNGSETMSILQSIAPVANRTYYTKTNLHISHLIGVIISFVWNVWWMQQDVIRCWQHSNVQYVMKSANTYVYIVNTDKEWCFPRKNMLVHPSHSLQETLDGTPKKNIYISNFNSNFM